MGTGLSDNLTYIVYLARLNCFFKAAHDFFDLVTSEVVNIWSGVYKDKVLQCEREEVVRIGQTYSFA